MSELIHTAGTAAGDVPETVDHVPFDDHRRDAGPGPGSILTLNRLAGEPVDLLVNGKPMARGEVVVIDEELGLRSTEVSSARGTDPLAE